MRGQRLSRAHWRREAGQTILEFALVAPIILLFLYVIIDFGIAMDRRITLQHAVREGARMAAVKDDVQQICDYTVAEAQDLITSTDISLSYADMDVPPDGRATDAGDSVRVTASFTYSLPIIQPLLSGLFGGSVGVITMDPWGSARLESSVSGATVCP